MMTIKELKPCPFCNGEAVIRVILGKPCIMPIHKKWCRIRCDTWLISSEPIEKQVKIWNGRAAE